jgi:tRNA threonylcarbamoyladenosine biosynthesis protein TsaB
LAAKGTLTVRILALETSLFNGSIALASAGELIFRQQLPPEQRTAQTLAPAIAAALREVDWKPADVNLVAVTTGPGSFTGLRVGVTTARTFSYAVGAGILGINTLEVIARQASSRSAEVWAVMDAQRGELFAARYARGEGGRLCEAISTHIVPREQWLGQLDCSAAVMGPGLKGCESRLPDGLMEPSEHWDPRAETVAAMAWELHQLGLSHDVWHLVPEYFRKSAAEEKLA